MKIGNPNSRMKLKIKRGDQVLDVGSGHNPHPFATVITDKFISDNYHRSNNIKVLKKQRFVEADGEKLPFEDKEFDYVICCHVVEHVENPAKFLDELGRVGKMGYLECPSLLGEFLIPKASHKWVVLEINNKLVVVDKTRLGMVTSLDFGELFQEFLPKNSIGYKILQRTHNQLFTVNLEWKDSIDYIIEPSDVKLMQYFNEAWNEKVCAEMMPKRSVSQELLASSSAVYNIFKSVMKSKFLKIK